MDDEQLRQHVIRRIAGGVDRNDVILEICQVRGVGWREAEALVAEVASTTTGEVARRRFPLFAFLAAGVILGGVALISSFIIVLLMPLADLDRRSGTSDIAQAGGLIAWLILNPEFVAQLVLGVAMVIGGAVGLYRVMRETLEV